MGGVIWKSVLPYIKQLFNIEAEFEMPHEDMILFIQEPDNDTEIQLKEERKTGMRAFHIIWFWTDNENQGINFMEKSCKAHLPAGTLLVVEDTGEQTLDLIPTESKNVGVYCRVFSDLAPPNNSDN